eukprot:SAG22_NODE_164_length_16817_cov_61.573573_8_plen_65_part_00
MACVMIVLAISLLASFRFQVARLYSQDQRVLDLAAEVMLVYFIHMAFTGACRLASINWQLLFWQ